MIRYLYWLFGSVLFFALLGVLSLVAVFWYYGHDLPDTKQLQNYQPPITTRIYANNGQVIKEFAIENRLFVPINVIPERVINAFLSAEDKTFYQHPGIDMLGVIRAVIKSVRNMQEGKRPEGASTITQQVATNFLLNRERTIDYKVRQILLSFRLENTFTKDQILELYLNEIYLGRGVYGVASAALNYFNKSLDELTIEEAAYLAALPKAPSNYHPVKQKQRALARRNWVIGRMYENGKITKQEAEDAKKVDLTVVERSFLKDVPSEYFVEELRRRLIGKYKFDGVYKGGLTVRSTMDPEMQKLAVDKLRAGLIKYDRRHGWRGAFGYFAEKRLSGRKGKYFGALDANNWVKYINDVPDPAGLSPWKLALVLEVNKKRAKIGLKDGKTGTISLSEVKWARKTLRNQRIGGSVRTVAQVLRKGDVIAVENVSQEDKSKFTLRQIPKVSGAIVVLDPHTGRVLALSGGYSYEMSEFNRATQAMRQPGSAFKPFVYLSALNKGYSPASTLLDAPIVLQQGPGLPLWRPKNYSGEFYGPTPLRVGVEKSRNLMTVRLAYSVGMDDIKNISEQFGIYENLPAHLSMALGAGETTVLKMVSAYAMVMNGGKKITPTFIDRIQNRHGETVFKHDKRPCDNCQNVSYDNQDMVILEDNREQINDPRTSYQMVSIMEGVVQRGTGVRLKSLNTPIAGKTGTTNESKDAWFIGFTPDLVVGVYVGFDNPLTLGKGETGSSVAIPIFKSFMEVALKDKPKKAFRIPDGLKFMDYNGIAEAFVPGTEPGSPNAINDYYWGDELYSAYQDEYGDWANAMPPSYFYDAPQGWENAHPPSYQVQRFLEQYQNYTGENPQGQPNPYNQGQPNYQTHPNAQGNPTYRTPNGAPYYNSPTPYLRSDEVNPNWFRNSPQAPPQNYYRQPPVQSNDPWQNANPPSYNQGQEQGLY